MSVREIKSTHTTAWVQSVLARAEHPTWKGKKITSRKVVEIGKAFYWDKQTPLETGADVIYAFDLKQTLGVPIEYNSILVNYYEESGSISYHCDETKNLVSGSKVYSVSFSLQPETEKTNELGTMFFETPAIGAPRVEYIKIKYGDVIVFDPFEDKKNNRKHKATTKKGVKRINFTFRHVIENKNKCCVCGVATDEDEDWCDKCWE